MLVLEKKVLLMDIFEQKWKNFKGKKLK